MSIDDERKDIWQAYHTTSDRVTRIESICEQHSTQLHDTIRAAVREAMPSALLSDDEHAWVKLAIKRDAQSIAFRQAVIEKSTIGLVWAGLGLAGVMFMEFLRAHGWKS